MSQSLSEQINSLEIEVSPNPLEKFRNSDPISEVLGIRSNHTIMLIGESLDAGVVKYFQKTMGAPHIAATLKQIRSEVSDGFKYDRVLVFESLTPESMDEVIRLSRGLVAFFELESPEKLFSSLENRFPDRDVWLFTTNIGPVVVTDARAEHIRQ